MGGKFQLWAIRRSSLTARTFMEEKKEYYSMLHTSTEIPVFSVSHIKKAPGAGSGAVEMSEWF